MAKLTPEQQTAVEQWAAEGASLNDIQHRLKNQFGLVLTYLDARLLMVDLNVKLKDKERPKEPEAAAPAPAPGPDSGPGEDEDDFDAQTAGAPGKVSITLDQLALPGTMCSGKATFSDGKTAHWYIDQMGRLGMRAPEPGYKPPAADVPVFQEELEKVLAKAGF